MRNVKEITKKNIESSIKNKKGGIEIVIPTNNHVIIKPLLSIESKLK